MTMVGGLPKFRDMRRLRHCRQIVFETVSAGQTQPAGASHALWQMFQLVSNTNSAGLMPEQGRDAGLWGSCFDLCKQLQCSTG